jgi:hypothetical protein
MVANLTIGRKKYAHVEEEMLELMQDDINEFGPLARLYRERPKTEQEKRRQKHVLTFWTITV